MDCCRVSTADSLSSESNSKTLGSFNADAMAFSALDLVTASSATPGVVERYLRWASLNSYARSRESEASSLLATASRAAALRDSGMDHCESQLGSERREGASRSRSSLEAVRSRRARKTVSRVAEVGVRELKMFERLEKEEEMEPGQS